MTTTRRLGRLLTAAAIACAYALAAPAHAQNDRMTPIATPAQPDAIVLGTGPLPGAKARESWHSQYGSVFARNVTVATLTPFLPDPARATGAAVIVAPGGGFKTLSMNNEGWDVAKALAARGVAAFVLKYRLNQTPQEMAAFEDDMRKMFSGAARPNRPPTDNPASRWRRRSPTRAPRSRSCARGRGRGTSIRTASAWWAFPPARC